MIKKFILAKLFEKLFKMALQGDVRGVMKYFKIALAGIVAVLIFSIIGIFFLLKFIYDFIIYYILN